MKIIVTTLLLISFFSLRAQEQEDYFARQLFKEKYKTTEYSESEQKNFLGWMGIDSLTNPGLKELVFLREGATKRRFKFFQVRKDRSNPIIWYVELTNPKATEDTEQTVFVEDAVLTFYSQGATVL